MKAAIIGIPVEDTIFRVPETEDKPCMVCRRLVCVAPSSQPFTVKGYPVWCIDCADKGLAAVSFEVGESSEAQIGEFAWSAGLDEEKARKRLREPLAGDAREVLQRMRKVQRRSRELRQRFDELVARMCARR